MGQRYEADIAVSFPSDESAAPDKYYNWTGWQRRHWPVDSIRPGMKFYAFNTAKGERRLSLLLEVTKGGSFAYSTKADFGKKVEAITDWDPFRDDPHWQRIPTGTRAKPCYGIAMRWKLIKRVDIPLNVRFPQIGWYKLDPHKVEANRQARRYGDLWEGGKGRLVTHLRRERSQKLWNAAFDYWQSKLKGRICCLACGFCFEDFYGDGGKGVIEMHHQKPFSSLRKKVRQRVTSLVPVCSNCHRMIHIDSEHLLTTGELKRLIRRAATVRRSS